MEQLERLLQQLRQIMPDDGYARRSRMQIIGFPVERRTRLTPWSFVMHNLQIGSAIALVALLLIVGFGGFSGWKLLSPFRIASLDVANLRAEAEAISDIQVRLDGVAYTEAHRHITSTISRTIPPGAKTTSIESAGGTEDKTPKPLTIDEALDILSQ